MSSSSNLPMALAESTRRAIERAEVLGQSNNASQQTLDPATANDSSSDNSISNECSICLEDVPQAGAPLARPSDGRHYLPCAHFFHDGCITQWLQNFGSVCPICRRDPSQAETELLGASSPVPSSQSSSSSEHEDENIAPNEERATIPPLLLTLLLAARYPGLFHLFEDVLPPSILEPVTQTNSPLVRSPRVSVHEDDTASISSDDTARATNTATAVRANEEPECSICMLPLREADQEATTTVGHNATDLTSRTSALPCGHTFHFACISTWLVESHSSWGVRRCPLCRYQLTWQAAQAVLNSPRQQNFQRQTPAATLPAQNSRLPSGAVSRSGPLYRNDPGSTETIVPQNATSEAYPLASTSRNNAPSAPSYLWNSPSLRPAQISTRPQRSNGTQQPDINARLQQLSTVNTRRARIARTSHEAIRFPAVPAISLNDASQRRTNDRSTTTPPNNNDIPNNRSNNPFDRLRALPAVPTTSPGDAQANSSQSTIMNQEDAYSGILMAEPATDSAVPTRPAPIHVADTPRLLALAQQDASLGHAQQPSISEAQRNAHTQAQPALAEQAQARAPIPITPITQEPMRREPMSLYTYDPYRGSKGVGCSECCDCIGDCIKPMVPCIPWVMGIGLVYAVYAFIRHVIVPACTKCCCCNAKGAYCCCKPGHECCC
jgi:hypothetical protein